MSKPLVEYVDPAIWKVLLVLIVLGAIVGSIIGAINVLNEYEEPINPLYDPYYYNPYEGRDEPWEGP